MPRKEQLLPLRNFKGINLADGGERADILEFLSTQNIWQKDKGVFGMIPGSTSDLQASDIPGCRRITAIHRHTGAPCKRATLYHCTPTADQLTSPGGGGLSISEPITADGTIFDSITTPVSKILWFCFSYVGMGVESSWDTRARAGFVTYPGYPLDSWAVGAQSHVMTSTTNKVELRHNSAFPTGVRAVNVFMAMGDGTDGAGDRRQFAYVGQIKSNTDVLTVNTSIGPGSAYGDSFTTANIQVEASNTGGSLPAGQYYVALAWVSGKNSYSDVILPAPLILSDPVVVQLTGAQNSIGVNYWDGSGKSTNGATHCYVFIGAKPYTDGPMTCVGQLRITTTAQNSGAINSLLLTELPYNNNAGTYYHWFMNSPKMRAAEDKTRNGFIVKKDASLPVAITEVFPARSYNMPSSDPDGSLEFIYLQIRTPYDLDKNGSAAVTNPDLEDPSMVYFSGLSYLANGRDFLVTDGLAITKMIEKSGCVIPKAPKRLGVIKSQLICTTAQQKGVVCASNALAGNNWSDGGTGTAIKFLVIGDAFQQAPASFGVFSYTSGTEGPRTLLIAFQKNSIWSAANVPDATSGVNPAADQLSGKIGNIAWRAITQTKVGMLFLGADGNVYLLRGAGEPFPIGRRIKPLLQHLAKNDSLMKMCSAVYHDDHWKLAYPSTPTSTYCDAELWADLRTEDGSPIQWYGPHAGREIGCQMVSDADGDDHSRFAALVSSAGSARLDDPSADQNLGVDITSVWEWTLHRLGSEWNNKRWKGVFVDVFYDSTYQQNLLVEGFADDIYTQRNFLLCPGDANGEARWRDHAIYFPSDNLIGKRFKFKLTHTGKPLSLSAIGLPWKPERRVA